MTAPMQALEVGANPVDDGALADGRQAVAERRVLSLCDRSGVMVRPWLEAGWSATIVDIQHGRNGLITREDRLTKVGADVREWVPLDEFDVVFAFPPCTHLAASGARWFQEKGLAALIESLQLVEACRRICESLTTCWMLENPHGTLSTYWRKPDYTFDPCDFGGYLDGGGDRYTKRTNLWCGPGFTMPAVRRVEPVEGSRMHFVPPGPERANLRSVTPEGFARAVFEANRHGQAEDLLTPFRTEAS